MLNWISANSGDIVVISVLVLIVAAVIAGMIPDKKKGRPCGGCSGCSGCSGCTACSTCGGCGKR